MEFIHKPKYIVQIILADVMFVILVVFSWLATGGTPEGVFRNSTTSIANEYHTEMTPAGWTFYVGGFIYIWQGSWLAYGLSTLFRRTSYGYLYIAPGHMHPSLYLIFFFSLAANAIWLVFWDRQYMQWSLAMIIITAVGLYTCICISWMRLHARGTVLKREGYGYEVWLVRGFVQNGLGIYAAWVTVLSLLNLNIVMQYYNKLAAHTSGSVCIALLLLTIICWFFLDNFLADKYTRYTITPYFLFIFTLIGCLVSNWDIDESNCALTVFALVIACLATILKIILLLVRHVRRPSVFSDVSFFSSQSVYGSTSRDKVLFYDDKDFT